MIYNSNLALNNYQVKRTHMAYKRIQNQSANDKLISNNRRFMENKLRNKTQANLMNNTYDN